MWSDKESSEDYLNFGEVSQLAVDVLTTENMLPVSIGIFEIGGRAKSLLLKLIEQKLSKIKRLDCSTLTRLYQGYDDARTLYLKSSLQH